ncbi:MAG: adenylyl-sulfate kinase, partial [Alphaproteobacteria bacterium]|nr:adenylyl-sulfate kinase [Alphaproteobacteria bacterium]
TPNRRYVIIDAPGHKEFLKNMVTGAAAADAALLVIDAEQGVSEQTRRHAYLLHLLGVPEVAVVINKMDLVNYSQERFMTVEAQIRKYLRELGIAAKAIIPVSARDGININKRSDDRGKSRMGWWKGNNVVSALDSFTAQNAPTEQGLRFPVQDVYRQGDQRYLVGRITSGLIRVGDQLQFSPGGQTARVQSIIDPGQTNNPSASLSTSLTSGAGQSIALTLDEEIFVERGHIASHRNATPVETNTLNVRLFWLDKIPLNKGDRLVLKLGTAEHTVTVADIRRVIDVETLQPDPVNNEISHNAVADVTLRSRSRMALDAFVDHRATGRGVLVRDYRVVGGCIFEGAVDLAAARHLTAVDQTVTQVERLQANGHAGGVLWLTGLSGSGKSTLAMALQRKLFERGDQVYVLDGDNVRQGLNNDLGFGPVDRTENIRRIAEVANLFADAGFIVVTAFISPYREDRDNARAIVGNKFREVFVKASLAACEGRDPKGLYVKARAGEIPEFTGISAPYEEPLSPELVVDTEHQSLEAAVAKVLADIDRSAIRSGDEKRKAG